MRGDIFFCLLVLMFFSGLDGWVIGTLLENRGKDNSFNENARSFFIGVAVVLTVLMLVLAVQIAR